MSTSTTMYPALDGETEKLTGETNAQQPLQPGMQAMQPGMQPMQPGMQPMQPGMQPMQPGMQPMQPGMQPMQPGMQPMQPGMQPMQPGMQPMQPGQQMAYYNPGQPGGVMMPAGQMQYAPGMVMQQPGAPGAAQTVMMPVPQSIPGCPPGLEYLTQLDQLLVHQQIELAEIVTNIDFENKYQIKNSLGQQVYFAKETSDDCMRVCCGPARGFVINITDNFGQEVIKVSREFKCCAGCCWCSTPGSHCSYFIEVESPPGTIVGRVRQSMSFASPHFDVLDASDQCILKIRGHWCRCQGVCCTDDINFKIFTPNLDNQVGRVSKQWGGWVRESYTQADNFGVEFPADMDVKTKAVLLASTFLIDFMYFEQKKNNNKK